MHTSAMTNPVTQEIESLVAWLLCLDELGSAYYCGTKLLHWWCWSLIVLLDAILAGSDNLN